jgi:hypothetical protein
MKPGPTSMGTGSNKQQAPGFRDPGTRVRIIQDVRHNVARQYVAGSYKLQATSYKLQATSYKRSKNFVMSLNP